MQRNDCIYDYLSHKKLNPVVTELVIAQKNIL